MKRSLFIRSLLALAALSSHLACATSNTDADWTVACQLGAHKFAIHAKSAANDVLEDDMRVTLVAADGTERPIGIQAAWYHDLPVKTDKTSLCDGLPALAAPGGLVVLWIAHDDRPDPDTVTLLLIDPVAARILDIKENVGTALEEPYLLEEKSRFRILLGKEWITGPGHADLLIPEWLSVGVKRGRLDMQWEHATR